MEADYSALVYLVILGILLAKVFSFGCCGGGTCD
jgi:hypothetical protein